MVFLQEGNPGNNERSSVLTFVEGMCSQEGNSGDNECALKCPTHHNRSLTVLINFTGVHIYTNIY